MSTFTTDQKNLFLAEKVFDWRMEVSHKNFLHWRCQYKWLGTWWSDNVIIFYWCFKLLNILINRNVCTWILIVFGIFCRPFFNDVNMFLMYSSSGNRWLSVSGVWLKYHIIVFISYDVTIWNWDSDCRKSSSNVIYFYVLMPSLWTRLILLAIM